MSNEPEVPDLHDGADDTESLELLRSALLESNDPKVLVHFDGKNEIVYASYGVQQVKIMSHGPDAQYIVDFEKPFKSRGYIVVATSTAGYIQIKNNYKRSVRIMSFNRAGNPEDAEVFLAIFGDQ
jgi:hypothetical protein